jgi:hypothetical protein
MRSNPPATPPDDEGPGLSPVAIGPVRRALRSAGPNAAERITLEIEAVAVELRQATTSLGITEVIERPLRVTPKLVRQTIDEITGILEHAPLDTRVA